MNNVPYGFIDLNVDATKLTTKNLIKILSDFIEYGYKVVTLNTILDLEVTHGSKQLKKKKSPSEDPVPLPHLFNIPEELSEQIQVLKRITVKYSEPGEIIKLKDSKNFKQYQIFAVQPCSSNSFNHACSTLEVDLISFTCGEKLPFSISRKMYQVAVQRGIHFELCYSSLSLSSESRIHCIQICHSLSIAGKALTIVLSSGAAHSLDIRSPHEIQSLALLLGLSHVQAKQSLETHPRTVILRAYGRRQGKTLFNIETREDQEDNDETTLPPNLKKLKMK